MKKIFILITILILYSTPINASVYFQGTDDIAYGSSVATTATGVFTMSMWIYWTNSGDGGLWFYNGSSDANGWGLATLSSTCGASNKIGLIVGMRSCDSLNCGTALSANTWTHVTVVHGATNYSSKYVNGVYDCTSANPVTPITPTPKGSYGYSLGTGTTLSAGDFMPVIMEDVCVWNVALTADEIAQLGKSKVKGICKQIQPANLQLYLPLDEVADGASADGVTLKDLSGNENNAVGDDGGNDTGLTGSATQLLTSP